ncbi:MAG: hypothetical protein E7617_01530 [Ruminococcaceae bacterium]|nr:hypothetical protein [Oscillospiraceae bacterium]
MKKNAFKSKRLLISLLLAAVVVSAVVVFASAADNKIPGLTFEFQNDKLTINKVEYAYPDATYVIQKHLEKMPQTVSAWVYIPSSVASSDVGAIIGNTEGRLSESGIDFTIGAGAVPTISVQKKYKGENKLHYDVKFENAKVPTDQWAYVTFVYDNVSGIASCYINGSAVKESKYFNSSISEEVLTNGFVFGGDNRELNYGCFKGGLGDVAVYSDVRSESEILADYEKGLSMTKADLDTDNIILYYDVDENDIGKNITDDSGNGYDVLYEKTWISESEMEEMRKSYGFAPSYSFAVVGDTQKITRFYPQNLPYIYDYIVDNIDEKNIKYSIGLGDITDKSGVVASAGSFAFIENASEPGGGHYERNDSGTFTEWDVAKHAITIMDGKLEYSLIAGNHDNGVDFDTYFASHTEYTTQFVNHGGMYKSNSVNNTWRTFAVGNAKYLIMNIAYNADANVFAWANEVLAREEHKDHNVIITTHAYLDCDGTALDSGDINCGTKNSGVYLWENLVSKHANVKLMLAGHVDVDKIVYSQRQGDFGNTVTQVLVNAQSIDRDAAAPAMVAMFRFSEDGNKLAIEYYSTVRKVYLKNPKVIDLAADAPIIEEDDGWMSNSISPEGSGTENDPYKIANGGNLLWMAEQISMSTSASLDGMYFEQTQDIDLNGQSIFSIGYYFGGESDMAAFGGHYDGNGYSIKNGTIDPFGRAYESSVKYGYGLFGVIFGATVENVVIENVEIVGAGLTGGIVGRAASPLVTDANFAAFNIISGCEIKDTVRIVLNDISPLSGMNFDNASRGGRFGSVCGMAHNTVIDACTSAASIRFGGDYGIGGGIVGSFGLNSTVSNCAFTGSMTLCDNGATETCMYGGIAGIISPTTKWGGDYAGYAHISNCYNDGNLCFEVSALTKNTHWAGILGGAPWIPYVASTEAVEYPYLIEGCYNLSAGPDRISTKSVYAGITGKNAATAGVTSTLYIKDSYSVTVTNAGGDTGTNEYRYVSGTTTVDGKTAVYAVENVESVTIENAESAAAAIDGNIAAIRSAEVDVVWYSGSGKPTFVPSVSGARYYNVENGFYYTYENGNWKNANGVETEYGIIPNSYSDAEAYPFLIFKNGEFAGAGDAWNTSKYDGVIANAIELASSKDDVVTVVLRRDYNHTQTTTLNVYNQLVGTLNVDLGDHTITTVRELIQFNHKVANTVNINIYNGTVKITARRLLSMQNQSSTVRQDLKLTFSDITIDYRSNWSLMEGVDNTSGLCAADIIFDNCKFDLTNYTGSAFTFITSHNDTSKSHLMHVVFKGGEFVSNVNFADSMMSMNSGYPAGEADTFRFEPDSEGNYTKFTMPSGVAAPTKTYNSEGVAFVKLSSDETNATYTLIENYIPGYGEIPTEYLDKEAYPFLIFKGGVCVGAGDNWNTSKNEGVIPTAISLATNVGDVVTVVLRRDFENRATATPNTYNKLVGTLNVDFCGNTLYSYREIMQFNHGSKANTVNVNIKNGNIVIAGRRLANLLNQSASVRQDLKLTFTNVNITHKTTWSIIEAGDSAAGLCVTDVVFENCTLDLTSHTSAFNIIVAGADANNSHVMHVVFKGGEILSDADFTGKLMTRKTGYAEGEADTWKFEKNEDGKYAKIEMPASLSAPTNVYNSNAKISYALISTDGTTAVYELGESVVTAYGEIPFLYADITKYPFALFQNGIFNTAYATWYDFCQAIGKVDTSESKNTVLLVRDDHISTASSANLYTVKYITIDLNGNTLTRGSYHLFNLSGRDNKEFTANITVKNGTLNTTHSVNPPISFNSNNKQNVGAEFNVTFDSVTFTAASNHSGSLVMVAFSDGTYGAKYNMVFNDCTFDATGASITNLFGMADGGSSNKFDVNVTVNGGQIFADKYFEFATFSPERVEGEGSPDTLAFGKNAVDLILPENATAPGVSNVYKTSNGIECIFVKASATNGKAVYRLTPKMALTFVPKSSITLGSELIFNIYVPMNANLTALNLDGAALDLSTLTVKDGYYLVTVSLGAREAAREIKLTATLTVDGKVMRGTFTFSIPKYAEKLLSDTSASATEKTLVKDVLSYIRAAYTFFGTEDAEAMAKIDALLGENYDETSIPVMSGSAEKPTLGITAVTYNLDATPALRFYLADGYNASDFAFSIKGSAVAATEGSDKNGRHLEVKLYAYELAETVDYTVNGESDSCHIRCYYEWAATQNNDALTKLVSRFAKYCESAKAYRESVAK